MPKKATGAKKARWSAAQKASARKAPKKPHHRGQPDGPRAAATRSGSTRSVSSVGGDGPRSKRPRSERSSRWDGADAQPNRMQDSRAERDHEEDRREERRERPAHRPHDERPRRERGDRPVRDRGPRVADPARRDRHEGRRAADSRGDERRSESRGDERRSESRRPDVRGRDERRPDGRRAEDRRADARGREDRRPDNRRPDNRRPDDRRPDDRRRPVEDRRPADPRPRTFAEAEAERAEADSWTTYTSTSGGPREVTADNGFAAAGLPARLVERLARDGIVDPFPIQAATVADALAGRDVLGRARTGSGKTLAFGLPTLARLADRDRPDPKRPRALVLVPTRELAMQVSDALQPFVHVLGLRHRLVAGGLSYEPQVAALRRGVDLLVATPGRLTDLMERGAVELGAVEVAVLDEADHMADMGFLPEITDILDALPDGGQRLLFSATLDRGVDKLVDRYLVDPVTHSTDEAQAAVTTMSHHLLLVAPHDKKALTAELAGRPGRVIVFSRTQLGADRVARELRERGIFAAALHGGLAQGARNRVLGAFRDGRMPVLVATDVAARGIHVDDVGLVLQVDPPKDHKDYLHRAGRTARAGVRGAVAIIALPHQQRMVARILDAAGAAATSVTAAPGDATTRSIGGVPPSGIPVPDAVWRPVLDGGSGRESGRRGGPARRRDGGPSRAGRSSTRASGGRREARNTGGG